MFGDVKNVLGNNFGQVYGHDMSPPGGGPDDSIGGSSLRVRIRVRVRVRLFYFMFL